MSDVHPVETVKHSGGKKLGPLPVWGWGLILGAVAVAFMYYHNSQNAMSQASGPTQVPQDQTLADAGTTPAQDAGTEQELGSLQNELDKLQQTSANQTQTNKRQNQEIGRLQKGETHDHHPAQSHPHGGTPSKPHHHSHKKQPHISAGG